jgi:hypothetical protein
LTTDNPELAVTSKLLAEMSGARSVAFEGSI